MGEHLTIERLRTAVASLEDDIEKTLNARLDEFYRQIGGESVLTGIQVDTQSYGQMLEDRHPRIIGFRVRASVGL